MTIYTSLNLDDKARGNVTGADCLTFTTLSGGVGPYIRALDGKSTGKWFFQVLLDQLGHPGSSYNHGIGLSAAGSDAGGTMANSYFLLEYAIGGTQGVLNGTPLYQDPFGGWGSPLTLSCCWDADAELAWLNTSNNTNWNGNVSANPALGTGGQSTATCGKPLFPTIRGYSGQIYQFTANFGASAWTGTPPAGFNAWTGRGWTFTQARAFA